MRFHRALGATAYFLVLLMSHARAGGGDSAATAFSAEVAVTSDYVYRGQSFSNGGPAVQASAAWRNRSDTVLTGLHADAWVSSINFGADDPTKAEISATLGYETMLRDLAVDAGATYIAYPGAPRGGKYDYLEFHGSVTAPLMDGTVTAEFHYTPRYSGDAGPALFTDVEGTWPLGFGFGAGAAVGHAHLDPRAGEDYFYWNAGLTREAMGLTWDLRYHGNDARSCLTSCADRVALTISKAF